MMDEGAGGWKGLRNVFGKEGKALPNRERSCAIHFIWCLDRHSNHFGSDLENKEKFKEEGRKLMNALTDVEYEYVEFILLLFSNLL